jgi:nucleoside-diphosphate-sugar epimerase
LKREIILITGSSGFIGSSLAKHLSHTYQVIGVDRDRPQEEVRGVIYHTIDITSEKNVEKTLKEIRMEHGPCLHSVVHLVAYYSFKGEDDPKYKAITIDGTHSLLTQLKKNFTVEQFIFSSTMLVYAPTGPGEKIKDLSPIAPSWPYPISKAETEKILENKHADIPIVNLRIAGIYNDFCHSPTLSHQIIRIHEGWITSFPFPGNPEHGQSFLHLDDLVTAIEALIQKRHALKSFETFVLGEEDVLSFRELQKTIGEELHQRPWPILRIPKFIARSGARVMGYIPIIRDPFIKPWMIPHADEHFEVDISRFKKQLNWKTAKSLRASLPVMIENLKRDPHKWYAINKIPEPFYREVKLIGSEREKNTWLVSVFTLFIGILLLFNPFIFGEIERGEFWSQIISGSLITLFATLTLIPTLRWLRWPNALIGAWLMISPLIFETSSAAAYSIDTLIGALVMLASVYTPSPVLDNQDKGIPPGWSYNPSTAGQRLPIMFLAFLGFLFSRYLAAYQLGHIENVWDPFFDEGTARVLKSSVSKAFPVSDAGLGAMTYLFDVIAAAIGGKHRWRTMPWAVIMFGLMIIPAGITSITLVMLQPISVGAWCTLCLTTAFIMLLMVPPAIDEVLASIQLLLRLKKKEESFWKSFWLGYIEEQGENNPKKMKTEGSLIPLGICAVIGIWLMFVPVVFNLTGVASDTMYILAALITTFAIIAFSEVARIVRLVNIPLAMYLAMLPFFFNSMSELATWHTVILGFVLLLLSLPRGRKQQSFGDLDRIIHWSPLKS